MAAERDFRRNGPGCWAQSRSRAARSTERPSAARDSRPAAPKMRRSRLTFACARTISRKGFGLTRPCRQGSERRSSSNVRERHPWGLRVEDSWLDRDVDLDLRQAQCEIGDRRLYKHRPRTAGLEIPVLDGDVATRRAGDAPASFDPPQVDRHPISVDGRPFITESASARRDPLLQSASSNHGAELRRVERDPGQRLDDGRRLRPGKHPVLARKLQGRLATAADQDEYRLADWRKSLEDDVGGCREAGVDPAAQFRIAPRVRRARVRR